jgi:hypothetical protein
LPKANQEAIARIIGPAVVAWYERSIHSRRVATLPSLGAALRKRRVLGHSAYVVPTSDGFEVWDASDAAR